MAIPNDRRIGRTRFKLARMIAERFPELETRHRQFSLGGSMFRCVDPFKLTPQIPVYASSQWDCCSWYADLPLAESGCYHIYSWDKMSDLVRFGFDVHKNGYDVELSAKGQTPKRLVKRRKPIFIPPQFRA